MREFVRFILAAITAGTIHLIGDWVFGVDPDYSEHVLSSLVAIAVFAIMFLPSPNHEGK